MQGVLSTCCWVEHWWENGMFKSPFFVQAVHSQQTHKLGVQALVFVWCSHRVPQSLLCTVGKQVKLELAMDLGTMLFSIWPDTIRTRGTDCMWTIFTLVQHWPLISTAAVLTSPELWKLGGLLFLRGEGSVPETITYLYTSWNRSVCERWQSSVINLEGYEMHSGYGHSESTVVRNWKDENGNRQRGAVPIPTPVYHYNIWVG